MAPLLRSAAPARPGDEAHPAGALSDAASLPAPLVTPAAALGPRMAVVGGAAVVEEEEGDARPTVEWRKGRAGVADGCSETGRARLAEEGGAAAVREELPREERGREEEVEEASEPSWIDESDLLGLCPCGEPEGDGESARSRCRWFKSSVHRCRPAERRERERE